MTLRLALYAFSPVPSAPWAVGGAYGHWGVNLIVIVLTTLAVAICVILHYEALSALSRGLGRREHAQRRPAAARALWNFRRAVGARRRDLVFGGVFFLLQWLGPGFGEIRGIAPDSLVDHVYFSAVTFTTVGFGDVIPEGPVRFLAGTEALCGFVLITWSASFTYLEMHRFWRRRG